MLDEIALSCHRRKSITDLDYGAITSLAADAEDETISIWLAPKSLPE